MTKAGDRFENPITGETGCILVGTEETDGAYVACDLRVSPAGRVSGEHLHRTIRERFTVLEGELTYTLGKIKGVAKPGDILDIPENLAHDWWNEGEVEARVLVEVMPAARFELLIRTLFGLAVDGQTDAQGKPHLLQLAVIAAEFSDVIEFTRPPIWLQRVLFTFLAPLGHLLGYKAIYPHHAEVDLGRVEMEPLPDWVELLPH